MISKRNVVCPLLFVCGGLILAGGNGLTQTKKPAHFPDDLFGEMPKMSPEEWQKKFPFQSMEERLQFEGRRPKAVKPPKLSPETTKRLDAIDEMAKNPSPWSRNVRAESLKLLHSKEVAEFIKRDGFGVRRVPTPSVRLLHLPPGPSIPFESVGYKESDIGDEAKVNLPAAENAKGGRTPLPSTEALTRFHLAGEYNFLNPSSFGFVKDKKNVAGFEPHQFRYKVSLDNVRPQPAAASKDKERWALHRLELVSLIKHEKPVVYVSDKLPRMEDLKKAKTRALTAFEDAGLKELLDGKDLVTEATTNRIRMLGALRANSQCLQCHGGERGELLGIFSYEMLRDPPVKVQ